MIPHRTSMQAMLFFVCLFFLFSSTPASAVVRITDPGNKGEPVAGQTVTLTFPDKTEKEAKTDDDGILFWPDGTAVDRLPSGTTISGGYAFIDVTGALPSKTSLANESAAANGHIADNGCSLPGPDHYQPITVGPNDKYGSGAELEKKAKGAAFGLLNKAIGSSGFSFGGGGDKKEGPKTVKDPTSGDFVKVESGDNEIGVRTGFTDDGFVVSSRLFNIDGDGTFHAMWLEDADGNRIFPYKYLIISLYREWKLTVSWTYDHWTNGVHDEHREGGWIESGRDHLGTFPAGLEGEEGVKKSIWYTNGFDTAVNGINHIGAVFSLNPSDFDTSRPLHLVTHITQPDMTPNVTTIPFIHDLFVTPEPVPDKNLIVQVRPHLVSPEE